MSTKWLSSLAAGALVATSALMGGTQALALSGDAELLPPNPTCTQLGYAHEFVIDGNQVKLGPSAFTFASTERLGVFFTGMGEPRFVTWMSSLGIDRVLVKGDGATNVYTYAPEARREMKPLGAPLKDGKPTTISKVSFCYDYELQVTKSAHTTFTRSYDWTISKWTPKPVVHVDYGQKGAVNYVVKATAVAKDSQWMVSGRIRVTNPDPLYTAFLKPIQDVITGGITVPVHCPSMTVAPGQTLTCSYGPVALPNGMPRLNTATVETVYGKIGGDTATARIAFVRPTKLVDECAKVWDSQKGYLGTTCVHHAKPTMTKTYEYSVPVASHWCGVKVLTNRASLLELDTWTFRHAKPTSVRVYTHCLVGCTLNAGYWKTHSDYGPAAANHTWDKVLPRGEDTMFFTSGRTWLRIMWTPTRGIPYYVLAQQYVAATLNGLNGASTFPVRSTLIAAKTFFGAHHPFTVLSPQERAQVLKWASVLDAFNNGRMGVHQCRL